MELTGAAVDLYRRQKGDKGFEREGEWNGIEQMGSREWKGERERERERGHYGRQRGVAGSGDEGMWGLVVIAFFLC
jgi:hypothetical protein